MGSISAVFSLVSFILGLFCTRLKTAIIAGAVPALAYVGLVLIGLRNVLAGADLAYLGGWLTGSALAVLLPAVIASYLRRGIGALIRRAKGKEAA